ncbi:MAG TPA: hypothetical protein VLB76_15745 [Thermoanaerobaculia bacterium]|nr:hypothetical protein [Thermoanaerobaculia bacterium]
MELFRLHAYSVIPQKKIESRTPPLGGAIRITPNLRRVMGTNTRDAQFDSQPLVDFAVDPNTRSNETRDAVMTFAFGEAATAKAAAVKLADHLSDSMDQRSPPCLLVPAALREGIFCRVILWIFPREEAFQLRNEPSGPTIDILTDVFSQKSRHRKAAQFEGKNIRTGFLQGRVLDHQANAVSRDLADFWVSRFLQCVLSMKDDAGTRLLAKTIRLAYDDMVNVEAREQLHAGVMAIRHAPQQRISLATFADRYLDKEARSAFLARVTNDHAKNSPFNFQRDVFDSTLQFRVFQLESGVYVSSPLSEVGETVKITGTVERQLTCKGRIVDEKLRTRRA